MGKKKQCSVNMIDRPMEDITIKVIKGDGNTYNIKSKTISRQITQKSYFVKDTKLFT